MGDKDSGGLAGTTVRHSLHGEWSQQDLGEAFEISSLSVIAELDPIGERGVLREVLEMFLATLEPELERFEQLDLTDPLAGTTLAFEVHRLRSAAGQLGAMRLAADCHQIEKHLAANIAIGAVRLGSEVLPLMNQLVVDIIRVQRRLRALLQPR